MIITVIETRYDLPDCDSYRRYLGSPCESFGEAVELVNAHAYETEEAMSLSRYFIHNGERWYFTSPETGEILREYSIQRIA